MHRSRSLATLAAALVLLSVLTSCGGKAAAPSAGSALERELDLVAWPGTVEDGSNDPRFDWVHPFERQTGCEVTVKYATTATEASGLLAQTGTYDGGLVSSDIVGHLADLGLISPLDLTRVPGVSRLAKPLRASPVTAWGGRPYGIPFLYGPDLLLYDAAVIHRPPTSWRIVWRSNSPYAGRITALDSPITIAEAALYLSRHQRSLGITDPFELTDVQLDAAIALVRAQAPMVDRYWTQFSDEIKGFAGGEMVVGMGRPIVIDLLRSVRVRGVIPKEGVTGWVDAWVLGSRAAHPNCLYRWMQWSIDPAVQAAAAQWYGAAPANPAACPILRRAVGPSADTIRYGRCGDDRFLDSLRLWRTPSSECGNGLRGCMDYLAWFRAWNGLPVEGEDG